GAARLRGADRFAPARGRDRYVARDAAEARAERAHVDEALVPVARRRAGEIRKVAVAAGVDEARRLDRTGAAAILHRHATHAVAVALRTGQKRVQQHIDAGFEPDLVEHVLDGFRVEHDEHAAESS